MRKASETLVQHMTNRIDFMCAYTNTTFYSTTGGAKNFIHNIKYVNVYIYIASVYIFISDFRCRRPSWVLHSETTPRSVSVSMIIFDVSRAGLKKIGQLLKNKVWMSLQKPMTIQE